MRLRLWLLSLSALSLAALLAWASTLQVWRWDWTDAGRHSLSPATRALLQRLDGPVAVTAFLGPAPQPRRAVRDLVARYQAVKPDLSLQFVDPKQHPDRARAANVAAGGELLLRYGERSTKLRVADEAAFTAALLQLASERQPWVVFVTGHGERSSHGEANHDLGRFAEQLRQRGMRVQDLDPGTAGVIPDNTDVLVISAPQTAWQPAQLAPLLRYVERGGNLLWLGDPGGPAGLQALADAVGIRWLNGVVLSARSAQLGLDNPSFLVTGLAPDTPLRARGIEPVLLPTAAALTPLQDAAWRSRVLLRSGAESWTETGSLQQQALRFNPEAGEQRGPLALAMAMTRARGPSEQRVAVVGDGDFVANAYLANGANLDLGVALVHWLGRQDLLTGVTAAETRDLRLDLSPSHLALIAWGFPFVLPALLLLAGAAVWARRRRR